MYDRYEIKGFVRLGLLCVACANLFPSRAGHLERSIVLDWRELYSTAVHEPNPVYLDLLLSKTEKAILFRIQELNPTPGGYL